VGHRAPCASFRQVGAARHGEHPAHTRRRTLATCRSARPTRSAPGDRLEVEIVQPDGGRALVVGKLDAVPDAAGGCALRIVVCDAKITVLPAR
jgi:hypothetical protein